MNRLAFLLITALLIAGIASCEKDPNENGGNGGNDIPLASSITFGNYEGMQVVTFDSIDWEYSYNESGETFETSIDLDGDGNPDFHLFSLYLDTIWPDVGYIDLGTNLDRVSFHAELVEKEKYLKTDSTIIQTDDFPLVYLDKKEYCYQIDGSELIDQYPDVMLVRHEKEDILNTTDVFSLGLFDLFHSTRSVENHYVEYDEETGIATADVYQTYLDTSDECWNFPIDEAFYIGFKCPSEYSEGTHRLGWIKLIIEPHDNGFYLARPLETAIQK